MVSNTTDSKNPDVLTGFDVQTVDVETFEWVLDAGSPNLDKVTVGDYVFVYSYDARAFTHVGRFTDLPDEDGIVEICLVRLSKPVPRNQIEHLAEWKTAKGNPRTPFSKANTFSAPVDISARWRTVVDAMSPADRRTYYTLRC